jgi:hypothetical protein
MTGPTQRPCLAVNSEAAAWLLDVAKDWTMSLLRCDDVSGLLLHTWAPPVEVTQAKGMWRVLDIALWGLAEFL